MNIQTKEDYLEAKKYLDEIIWKRDNMTGSDSFTEHMRLQVAFVGSVLLAYRRQHNIFEMDDYIIHDGELKVFAMWSTAIEGCAYIGYAFAEDGEMADKDEFRHATDEEITAGHRL